MKYCAKGVTQEAEAAERGASPMTATCRAIVGAVVGLGVDQEDRKRTWMADADEALRRGSVHTARAILVHARTKFPGKKSIWRSASDGVPLLLTPTTRMKRMKPFATYVELRTCFHMEARMEVRL